MKMNTYEHIYLYLKMNTYEHTHTHTFTYIAYVCPCMQFSEYVEVLSSYRLRECIDPCV